MKKLYLSLLLLPLLAACATGQAGPQSGLGPEDLLRKNFALASVNGKAWAGRERVPTLQFNEGLRVSGQVCNRFMGQAQLKKGVLTVPQMASTLMMCADEDLNRLEGQFAALLRAGAEISLTGDRLTLRGGDLTLVYVRAEPEK